MTLGSRTALRTEENHNDGQWCCGDFAEGNHAVGYQARRRVVQDSLCHETGQVREAEGQPDEVRLSHVELDGAVHQPVELFDNLLGIPEGGHRPVVQDSIPREHIGLLDDVVGALAELLLELDGGHRPHHFKRDACEAHQRHVPAEAEPERNGHNEATDPFDLCGHALGPDPIDGGRVLREHRGQLAGCVLLPIKPAHVETQYLGVELPAHLERHALADVPEGEFLDACEAVAAEGYDEHEQAVVVGVGPHALQAVHELAQAEDQAVHDDRIERHDRAQAQREQDTDEDQHLRGRQLQDAALVAPLPLLELF